MYENTQINSIGWQHARVENNKTKPRPVASAAPHPITPAYVRWETNKLNEKMGKRGKWVEGSGGSETNYETKIFIKYKRLQMWTYIWRSPLPYADGAGASDAVSSESAGLVRLVRNGWIVKKYLKQYTTTLLRDFGIGCIYDGSYCSTLLSPRFMNKYAPTKI